MKRILLLAALLTAGFAAAEERKDGVSASGKIAWHVVMDGENGASEVFISEADQGESAARKLCNTVSVVNTQVFVAPDDGWIIVQTGGASLGVSLITFSREKGMIYQEAKGIDITETALLAACGGDRKKVESIDHAYVRFIGWAKDSESVLVEVNAQGEDQRVESFFGIYDLAAKKVGFDLERFNRGK